MEKYKQALEQRQYRDIHIEPYSLFVEVVKDLEQSYKEIDNLTAQLSAAETRANFFKTAADTNLRFFSESQEECRKMAQDIITLKNQLAECVLIFESIRKG